MGLAYRGQYQNPEMIERELELIDGRVIVYPRKMSTIQRDSLEHVTEGAVVYNLTTHKLNVYTGSAWEVVTSS